MMLAMSHIITPIVVSTAIMIILPLLVYKGINAAVEKENKKTDRQNRTQTPKILKYFFLIAASLFFAAMVGGSLALLLSRLQNWGLLLGLTVGITGALGGLSVFGLTRALLCYETFDEEKITIIRYSKRKVVKYEEIAFFEYDGLLYGVPGYSPKGLNSLNGLVGYDADGKKLFSCEGIVGLDNLAQMLTSRGISFTDSKTAAQKFKKNSYYIKNMKRTSFKVMAWTCFGLALLSVGLGALILYFSEPVSFTKYEITGTVESIAVYSDNCKIRLVDDESEYYLSSIVFRKVDKKALYKIKEGDKVAVCVGGGTLGKRLYVMGLRSEDNGTVYLSVGDAEEAENSNYHLGKITGYVCVGVSAVLMILWAVFLIYCKVKYPKEAAA